MSARRDLSIACAAAAIATAGDLLLLWTGNSLRHDLSLAPPPAWALPLGGVAGVLAIPFYALGYRAVAVALERPQPTLAQLVRAAGAGMAALGALIHGLTALAIERARSSGEIGTDPLAAVASEGGVLVAAWGVAALLLVLASGAIVATAVGRERALPHALALANPLALTLLFALAGAAWELGRAFLVPAAPNLAHVAFFALATVRASR